MRAEVGIASKRQRVASFEEAVNFFIRAMRTRHFVQADQALYRKYGDDLHTEVTRWCFQSGITIHLPDGRLALARRYKRFGVTVKTGDLLCSSF